MANEQQARSTIDLTLEQQKDLLSKMLAEAAISASEKVKKLLQMTQNSINKCFDMIGVIDSANTLVAILENFDDQNAAKPVLDSLRQKGLYRMLYRFPKYKGEDLPADDGLMQLLKASYWGVGISVLLIAAFVLSVVFAAPAWLIAITSGFFVGASVYLSGMLYGVVNDLFATQMNLPYFLLGHQPQQTSLLRTNDKVAQGVAWGMAATFGPVLIAAIAFTVITTITAFFVPIATFLLPLMTIALPLIAIGAEFYAQAKIEDNFQMVDEYGVGSNWYQRKGLDFMCPTPTEKASWFANSDRNVFGFTRVPIIGGVALVVLITLSAVSMFLPAALFTAPLWMLILPAAFSGAVALTLGGLGLYTYINRERHVDDRYNLEFDNAAVNYNLYIDEEDLPYVKSLLEKPTTAITSTPDPLQAPAHFAPLFSDGAANDAIPSETLNQQMPSTSI
ncbi:MAG: hypothetical protein EPN84_04490 [Legionella sp.]|nr:MAG: hypothetical protein EPN84_04490 [Legionella sp.]